MVAGTQVSFYPGHHEETVLSRHISPTENPEGPLVKGTEGDFAALRIPEDHCSIFSIQYLK